MVEAPLTPALRQELLNFSPTLHYPKSRKLPYEFLEPFEPGSGRLRERLSRLRS